MDIRVRIPLSRVISGGRGALLSLLGVLVASSLINGGEGGGELLKVSAGPWLEDPSLLLSSWLLLAPTRAVLPGAICADGSGVYSGVGR